MAAKIEFFRVDCGDMTLITFDSGKTLLIDCHIRKSADDEGDDTPDVATQLKDRLKKDGEGRPYVDAMLNSHPDKDHICGLDTHFHLGPLADYANGSEKIVIREMWSSPLVFRRASKNHVLCPDAKAWASEARRRVKKFREQGRLSDGDRILVMGEDIDGKTDDLGSILVKTDATWTAIAGVNDNGFEGLLLAPLKASDDDEEETLSKNNSSAVVRLKIGSGMTLDACRFLTGGDAEVAIWEKLWARHKSNKDRLTYDILQTPHHCSWHSLSWDSWSKKGENAKVSQDARDALGQARKGAKFIASSKPITDDDTDPPCIRAKREYKAIAKEVDGEFTCVGDGGPEPLEFVIEPGGPKLRGAKTVSTITSPALIGTARVGHG
jgi:hypothetical protein